MKMNGNKSQAKCLALLNASPFFTPLGASPVNRQSLPKSDSQYLAQRVTSSTRLPPVTPPSKYVRSLRERCGGLAKGGGREAGYPLCQIPRVVCRRKPTVGRETLRSTSFYVMLIHFRFHIHCGKTRNFLPPPSR